MQEAVQDRKAGLTEIPEIARFKAIIDVCLMGLDLSQIETQRGAGRLIRHQTKQFLTDHRQNMPELISLGNDCYIVACTCTMHSTLENDQLPLSPRHWFEQKVNIVRALAREVRLVSLRRK